MSERRAADSDRIIVAKLTGAARHHARWEPPDDATTAAAVAELREIAGDRTDLLAEVAGVFLGTSEGDLHEPRVRNAAAFCRAAGANPDLIPNGSRKAADGQHRHASDRSATRRCRHRTAGDSCSQHGPPFVSAVARRKIAGHRSIRG